MKSQRTETLLIFLITICPALCRAQSNHMALFRAAAARVVVPKPIVAGVSTNTLAGHAVVDVHLPEELSRYHVLEQHGQITHPATNFAATSAEKVRASIPAGSTLMFLEKESQKPNKPNSAPALRPLFSAVMVRAEQPARPGTPPATTSGTLTLFALEPIPWNDASNAYVADLTIMFTTEDQHSPFLPMVVTLNGKNVKTILPADIKIDKANPEGRKEAFAICDRYRPDVQITAYYGTTTITRDLHLQSLGIWDMIQMIMSKPMLFASLTGGLIGGLLRLLKQGRFRFSRAIHHLAEGSTVGLVTVTMLLAGLLQTQIAGISTTHQCVLAFALAASAGAVGAHFLDKAIANLRGKGTVSRDGHKRAQPVSGPVPH
jgi:hypothetical protein